MALADKIKTLDHKIKINQAQSDFDREPVKISASQQKSQRKSLKNCTNTNI